MNYNKRYCGSNNNDNKNLKVIVDLCVVPIKGDNTTGVSKEIALIQKMIDDAGLKKMMHAYGTNIEGNWDDVFGLIKKIHYELHYNKNIPRLSTTLKVGTRIDKISSINDKINSVNDEM